MGDVPVQAALWCAGGFLALAAALCAGLPKDRRAILLAGAGLLSATLAHALALHLAGPESAGPLRAFCVFLMGMAALGLLGVAFFRVLLPALALPSPRILQDVLVAVAYLVWGLACLSAANVNLAGLITTSAVLTAVIGFSMQDTLGNILGGLAIQLDRSLHAGDWIKVGEITGRVVETRWRFTAVETRNWETVLIPNSVLMKNQFLVLGRREGQPVQWRRWVWFNVDYRFPPAKVIETVERAVRAAEIPRVAREPLPSCVVMDFADSYARYAVRYWLTDLAADDPTDSEVRTHLFSALVRNGITLSIPAHAVFLTEESAARKASKETQRLAGRVEALGHVDLFNHLRPEELDRLAEHLKPAPFVRGDTMTRQGAEAHWLYILIEGHADVLVESGGESKQVAELGPGSFFGEMSLMTGEPRHATVVARDHVRSYRLDKESFQEILRARPELAESISALLARRRMELDATLKGLDAEARARHLAVAQGDILARIRHLFGLGT